MLLSFRRASRLMLVGLPALFSATAALAQTSSIEIAFASSLYAKRDTFEFRLSTGAVQRMTFAQRTITFRDIPVGTPFTISQISGPRTCQLDIFRGTMGAAPVSVLATCGAPPLSLYKMSISGVGSGEQFAFADEYGRRLTTTFNGTVNLGGFPVGDATQITQVGGPRACALSPAMFTVSASPMTIIAHCSASATTTVQPPSGGTGGATPGSGGGSGSTLAGAVSGTLAAPVGARVVLANGTDSLVVTARANGTALMTSTPFAFTKPGTANRVTVRRAPAGLRCAVSDTDPAAVRVACDRAWDLVSRSADDKVRATFYEAFTPVIGGMGENDGRYVAYVTYTAGIAGIAGKKRQVIWRDRWTGTTRVVSAGVGGVEGNDDSGDPAISADGRTVAFASRATNLIASGDGNGFRDVFVWHADASTVEMVSDGAGGAAANGESHSPALSADGRIVTFVSTATNLVSTPSNNNTGDVFVKDMRTGAITALSIEEKSGKLMGGARPAISDDGATVAFVSSIPLRSDDTNGLWDIYVWQRSGSRLQRVSKTASGAERQQGDESTSREVAPAVAGNGEWVTFATTAPNMSGAATTGQQVYIANVASGAVTRVSATAAGDVGAGNSPVEQGGCVPVSASGTWAAFMTSASNLGGAVVLKNLRTGEVVRLVEPGVSVGQAMVSHDGLYTIVGVGAPRDARFSSSGIFVAIR